MYSKPRTRREILKKIFCIRRRGDEIKFKHIYISRLYENSKKNVIFAT